MTTKATAEPAGNSATQQKARTVEVELAKPHTHAGKECPAGSTIKVTARQKAFLQESGKVAAVTGTAERVKES
ncbi:DUF7210 family protein [Stutzerimonas chloritidismutans]|uniref:DUF7210 family protein n=1 Tax=Stutzerimonas chloritidismutans TaxID=203192 RepID=UPI0028A80B0A|nr:hypothetical protein [Stutzerimonas chloritidismutans]